MTPAPISPPSPQAPTAPKATARRPPGPAREAWLAGVASVTFFACAWLIWKERSPTTGATAEASTSGGSPAALARSVMFPRGVPQRAGGFVNRRCPLHPNEVITPPVNERRVRSRRGERIALCCDECPWRWDEWPDERKDDYVRACLEGREPEAAHADAATDRDP